MLKGILIFIVMLIHIMFGFFLMKIWEDRHIWKNDKSNELMSKVDDHISSESWK